jgi:hypothetical protein
MNIMCAVENSSCWNLSLTMVKVMFIFVFRIVCVYIYIYRGTVVVTVIPSRL